MVIPEDKFISNLEKALKLLGFQCDEQEVAHQWNNVEFAIVITVWRDKTIDLCGFSEITVRDILGPLMDQMNEGEK